MALTVKDNTKIAVEIEDTEGVYKAPTAGTSFVQTLSDGTEMSPSKELLDRQIFNGSIGSPTPRTGIQSVSGALPVEMRAGEVEGEAPEYDALMRSALGSRRQSTSEVTTETGHTTTVINIGDADIASFNVGDSVLIKEAGAFHVSPIIAVDPTPAAANITLLVPAAAPPSDNVVIAKFTTYTVANSGHPSLSISKYLEDAVLESSTGSRVTELSMENFTTGQLANWNFGFEGLAYNRTLTPPPFQPDYQDALPPIILQACVFVDGVSVEVNEFSFTVSNELGFKTATCSPNGRTSSRPTVRTVTGTLNPYKEDDDVSIYDKFACNTEFSIFAYALVPTSCVPGQAATEYSEVVAIYIPSAIVTELGETDQDNLLQDAISFQAGQGSDSSENEIYITTI